MAVTSGQVALNSSTTTLIVPAANANTVYVGRGTSPRNVFLINLDGTNDAYLGVSTVTTSTGFKLAHGASMNITLGAGDAIYGISNSSTPSVSFLASGS